MRVLYKASLVFLLTDMYSRIPVKYASILCNGKQNPYTKKESGHYVFSNLYPGKYRIDIICKGFADVRMDLDVRANETRTIIMNLPYASDNDLVSKLSRLEMSVSVDGVLLKNKDVRIKLKNDLNFLKVIEPIKANTDTVSLNIEKNSGLTLQKYAYNVNGTENEFYIYSYDPGSSQYLTEDLIPYDLVPGGMLYPIWDLRTDDKGKVILPILKQFMKGNQLQLEVFANGKYEMLTTRVPDESKGEKVVYIDVNLVNPAPEPLPKVIKKEEPKAEELEDSIDDMEEGDEDSVSEGKSDKKSKNGTTSDKTSKKTESKDAEAFEDSIDDMEEGDEDSVSEGKSDKKSKKTVKQKTDDDPNMDKKSKDAKPGFESTESKEAEDLEDSIHESKKE